MHRPVRGWLVVGALALGGCGGEVPAPQRDAPVSAPAETWDLARLPDPGPVLEARSTPEGVRVLVLERGDGLEVPDAALVDIHYTGYLRDGLQFESGVLPLGGEGRPSRANLILGLRLGLAGIQHGERRRVLVPAAQAYGWASPRAALPSASDLVFDVRAAVFRHSDLQVGQGAEARPGGMVTVHYVGMFPDGRVFEDSRTVGEGKPATFALRGGREGVIPGWIRGVPGMRVGGRRRLMLPASLAYGAGGNARAGIGPYTDLLFTVELLDVPAGPPSDEAPR